MDSSVGPEIPIQPAPAPAPAPVAQGVAPRKSRHAWWWIGGGVAILLVAIGLGWHFKWDTPFIQGNVTFKVKEAGEFPVSAAELKINGTTYVTDVNGKVAIAKITAGTYAVSVTKKGYKETDESVVLHRGDNGLSSISITKDPTALYSIEGFAQDYVSGLPITNVSVTLGNSTVQTDPSGAYTFTDEIPGTYTLHFQATGYTTKDLAVRITTASVVTASVPLVPAGVVVYSSNTTGKRLLYTISYDGSNKQPLAAQTTGEDYQPVLSPNGHTVAFLSTRDNTQSTYGVVMPKLYVISPDGTNLKKVSDTLMQGSVVWSASSAWVYYEGFADAGLTQAVKAFYNPSTGKTVALGTDAATAQFTPDSTSAVYVSTTQAADGTNQYALVLINLASGQKTTVVQPQAALLSDLVISSDGTSIAYDSDTNGTHAEYSVVVATAQSSLLPSAPATPNTTTVISPDGKLKAYIDTRNGQTNLYLSNLDGTNEKQLTQVNSVVTDTQPVWDQSGNYLIFGVSQNGTSLYAVAMAGGTSKKITSYYDLGSATATPTGQ